MRQSRPTGGNRKNEIIRRILIAIFLFIFIFAAVKLIKYAVRSHNTDRVNTQVQELAQSSGWTSNAQTDEMQPNASDDTAVALPSASNEALGSETPDALSEYPSAENHFVLQGDGPVSATPLPTPLAMTEATPELQLLEEYQYVNAEILPEALEMYRWNQDLVAYIEIPGVLSLPVVYRDNTYYLTHDFFGAENKAGTVFLDVAHPLLADTQYLVLHGHNMHDGSMFAMLSHYRNRAYIDLHPKVYFNTIYRQEEYEVFAVLVVPGDVTDENFFPFLGQRKWNSVAAFQTFADSVKERARIWQRDAVMLPTDAFLSLSTCFGDQRIVVMCKRVSP